MNLPTHYARLLVLGLGLQAASATATYINEIHYDNSGADIGEAIELAGAAGTDLSGWSLVLYNGNTSAPYLTRALSGVIGDQQAGFGTLAFSFSGSGIQNGAADGMALVDAAASVIQFLSYEGTINATSGVAAGLTSTDIGVGESGATAVGTSLQLLGSGSAYGDFSWSGSAAASFGAINSGQVFTPVLAPASTAASVPAPASGWLCLAGLLGLLWRRFGFICTAGNRAPE